MGVADEHDLPFAGGAGCTAGPVTIYVANRAGNTVTPTRAASNRAGRPIKVGPGPELIAITPDSRTVYVSCAGTVVPVRAGADTASEPIRVSPHPEHRVSAGCQATRSRRSPKSAMTFSSPPSARI